MNLTENKERPGRCRAACLAVIAVLFLLSPAAVRAQDDPGRVERLEEQVKQLAAEVAALKESGSANAPDERLAELERKLEVLAAEIDSLKIGEAAATAGESEHGFGPAASKVYRTERGVSIGGYGELLYHRPDSGSDGGQAEFDLLRAVLYTGYKFNDRWLFNSEIEYEHAGEEVAVEFAHLDFLWRPEASFRAGLLLLPMGLLNELHEPTTFLGANRPNVERLILPSTWRENGFGLFGEAGSFSYRTYIVAGLDAAGFSAGGLRGGRQKGNESSAEDLAWVGRLDYNGVPGLLVGGSAYAGNSGQGLETSPGHKVGARTRILEGHLEWKWRGLELRALTARADLDDVAVLNRALGLSGRSSIGERLTGGYLQVGYDLLAGRGSQQALIPYGRWESYNTQDTVPAGFLADPVNDVEILTLGLAFRPIDQIVIKADHQSMDNQAGTGVDQFNVLLGWIF